MTDNSLFETEEKTIKDFEKLINDEQDKNNPFAERLFPFLKGYKKLFKQFSRIVKLSDMNQSRLKESKEIIAGKNKELNSLVLELQKATEKLHNLSIRDQLTDLYNRRYMEEILKTEISKCNRDGANLGVIMIDVDHFKNFNDSYGHAAGDIVLAKMGELLQNITRTMDIPCRYGGEEFIIIMPGISLEIALNRAEEIRAIAEKNLILEYKDTILPQITISLGVAVYSEHGSNSEKLLYHADKALYQAKSNGRNQVASA
jgi:diguanylate cyclase (GGDEF)-like protein